MTHVGPCMYPLHWKLALRLEKLQPVMKTYRSRRKLNQIHILEVNPIYLRSNIFNKFL